MVIVKPINEQYVLHVLNTHSILAVLSSKHVAPLSACYIMHVIL